MLEQIQQDFKEARLTKNERAKIALQLLITALTNETKNVKRDLTYEEIIKLIQKEIKNKNNSLTAYEQAGRTELANNEKTEIEVLSKYLPEAFTYEKLVQVAKNLKEMNKGVHEGKLIGEMNRLTKGLNKIEDIKRALQEV